MAQHAFGAMVRELVLGDSAVSAVEYAAILALIGAALVAAMIGFGAEVQARYGEAAQNISAP